MQRSLRVGLGFLIGMAGATSLARPALAQDLPRVTVTRELFVEGLTADARVPDVLGMARVRFQGLIATELSSVGYRLAEPDRPAATPPLVLVGVVKEEVCDDLEPTQCRIAVQWELQEQSGLVVYRTLTRAVEQQRSLHGLRRGLLQGSLRSLLARRRFPLRLAGSTEEGQAPPALGYVHDPDDPPFELTKRYTFGTAPVAKTVRTGSLVTASVGALGVAITWLRFRGEGPVTEERHARLVRYNDVSWAVLALGAVGVGVSYALPQAHEVVAGHGSARRQLRLQLALGGVALTGSL